MQNIYIKVMTICRVCLLKNCLSTSDYTVVQVTCDKIKKMYYFYAFVLLNDNECTSLFYSFNYTNHNIACLYSQIKQVECFLKKNYISYGKKMFHLSAWSPLLSFIDLSGVKLVRLFPLLAARARERGATAAFVWRNALPSIQAGLSAHSYSQEIKTDKRNNKRSV